MTSPSSILFTYQNIELLDILSYANLQMSWDEASTMIPAESDTGEAIPEADSEGGKKNKKWMLDCLNKCCDNND
ncbi:unnamed protein product, partial [Allacma fusca]